MKESKKKARIIDEVKNIVSRENLTPQEFRYIVKRVREQSKLQIPKKKKKLPDYLTPAEIYGLLESSKNNPERSLLIEFQIFTGLRIGETNNLMVHNIDWFNNQLKVVQGKGSKDRYVPITSNLQSKLKLYLNNRKDGYLFQKQNKKKYSKRTLQEWITKEIDKAEINKEIHTHSLRHTFACLCISRGISLENIQLMMGHTHKTTTEIYAKLELGAVKDQFLQLMDMRG